MKVKELIEKLKEANQEGTVFIEGGDKTIDFTGISYDDNNDVVLYEAVGDKEA